MFDNIRKQDREILKRSLKAILGIIFLQIMVIVHNLNDLNITLAVVFTFIFISYIVAGISMYSFFKSYFLENNKAWIDVEIPHFVHTALLIILFLATLTELYYYDYKIMCYSFLAHLLFYVDDKKQGVYSYMKFIHIGQNIYSTNPKQIKASTSQT